MFYGSPGSYFDYRFQWYLKHLQHMQPKQSLVHVWKQIMLG